MEDQEWEDILQDIDEQRAVLLLGQGFIPNAFDELQTLLQEKLGPQLQYVHIRDGLFLFSDGNAKTKAQQEAARFYRRYRPEENALRKIAEMPFRLLVSANPDKALVDAFAQYRLPLQFDYFSSSHKEYEYKLERPTTDKPLLYNLCGSVEDYQSLILDHEDLFKLLKNVLADIGIPTELRSPLLKTSTYIFIGFPFERWYTQLFLRYLNMNDSQFDNKSRNYVLKTTFQDETNQQFFLRQFKVKYIGADWAFFEELYRRFAQRFPDRLRKVVDALSPTATAIVQLVERADYAAAFGMLQLFTAQLDAEDKDLLSMTQSAYNQYEADKVDGTVLQNDLNVTLARIRKNILELAKKMT